MIRRGSDLFELISEKNAKIYNCRFRIILIHKKVLLWKIEGSITVQRHIRIHILVVKEKFVENIAFLYRRNPTTRNNFQEHVQLHNCKSFPWRAQNWFFTSYSTTVNLMFFWILILLRFWSLWSGEYRIFSHYIWGMWCRVLS